MFLLNQESVLMGIFLIQISNKVMNQLHIHTKHESPFYYKKLTDLPNVLNKIMKCSASTPSNFYNIDSLSRLLGSPAKHAKVIAFFIIVLLLFFVFSTETDLSMSIQK